MSKRVFGSRCSYGRLMLLFLVVTPFMGYVFLAPAIGYSNNYTHGLLDEHFVATYCPSCKSDEPNVWNTYQSLSGSFFVVSYHLVEWSTTDGNELAMGYYARTIPYHVFDGGYMTGKGRIVSSNIQDSIEASGTREVHKVSLAIRKTVEGSILKYDGSVQELEGKPFAGYLQVYITENGLKSEGVEWPFVFRAFGVRQVLEIPSKGVSLFQGTWQIPSNVEAQNLITVAAVFDNSTVGSFGPYAVQATNDIHSGQVIPEMLDPIHVIPVALLFVSFAAFKLKKNLKMKPEDTKQNMQFRRREN